MTKSDVDAELFGEPVAFRRPFERSGIGTKVLEVIDLLGVFELVPIHIFQYEGRGRWFVVSQPSPGHPTDEELSLHPCEQRSLASPQRAKIVTHRDSCHPPSQKTIGVCLIPSPVPKSEGSPSAGSGQAFDFAQDRFSTPRTKTCPWGPRLWGTLIVVGIAPGDRGHPPQENFSS